MTTSQIIAKLQWKITRLWRKLPKAWSYFTVTWDDNTHEPKLTETFYVVIFATQIKLLTWSLSKAHHMYGDM